MFRCQRSLQRLQTSCPHNESPGETGVGPSKTSAEHLSGPLQDGVDDVIIYLLHQAVSHLDKTGSTVRIMFQQQSSQRMQIDTAITSWIPDYLTGRPQCVQLCRCVSEQVVRSIAGGPSSHLSSSPCTPLTLSTTRSPVICRCIQMTLRLWRVSGLDRKQSTET